MMQEFDLIIIGAGSGNMIPGPDHDTWKIAIIEQDKFGGTCLNRGCIPSKMLIHAAEVADTVNTAGTFGVNARMTGINWHRVTGRVWERIDPIAVSGERYRSSLPNTTVYKGVARFVGEKVVEVNGERLHAPKIILAAGSRPRIPDIPGLDAVTYHTSDTIMRLPEQPDHLTIIGGGYIGAELGHFFGALGTHVTIIDRGDTLIKPEDDDIRQRFTAIYARKYNVCLNAQINQVRANHGDITVDITTNDQQRSITSDALLVAAGRIPNTDILQVAQSGIVVDAAGRVVTNEHGETNVAGIWALGDVTSPYQLKHTANMDARICAYNIVHPHAQRPVQYQAIPHAIFASPQVASVGVTEREARAKHLPYLVGKKDYSATAYGWAIEDMESFVKILGHRETREILGAHILGPHAAILLQPLINAMRFHESIDQLARDTIYIHPALTEVIENALLEM
jgi:mycothione reductase